MHHYAWRKAANLLSEYSDLLSVTTKCSLTQFNQKRSLAWSALLAFVTCLSYALPMTSCQSTKPQLKNGEDYNHFLSRCRSWAEKSKVNGTSLLNVEFKPEIDTTNHITKMTAIRRYRGSIIRYDELDPCEHKLIPEKSKPIDKFYFRNGNLSRQHSQSILYVQPEIPEVNLKEEHYPIVKELDDPDEFNSCAFKVHQGSQLVSRQYYTIEKCHPVQHQSYLYSTGREFFLACEFTAQCSGKDDHGKDAAFGLSYITKTPHRVIHKTDSSAVTPQQDAPLESPFEKEGLYIKNEHGRWVEMKSNYEPNTSNWYEVTHPKGPWIKEVKLSPFGESNEEILQTLAGLTYLKDIAGLDFGGREFSFDEQKKVVKLLKKMDHLTSLSLKKYPGGIDYKALVRTLIRLPQLTSLDVTNCGLDDDELESLKQGVICYNFGREGDFPYFKDASGFCDPKKNHRWTEGEKASLQIPISPSLRGLKCISFLKTSSLINSRHTQRVTVRCNGKHVGEYEYTKGHKTHNIHVPILSGTDEATITFEMPNAISPKKLRMGDDKRKLGISFGDVKFSFSDMIYNFGGDLFHTTGFSHSEGTQRWTGGTEATLEIPVVHNRHSVKSVIFKDTVGLVEKGYNQRLNVTINGKPAGSYLYTLSQDKHTFSVPIPEEIDDIALIHFNTPDATSPASIGRNYEDRRRRLGVLFRNIELSFSKVQITQ